MSIICSFDCMCRVQNAHFQRTWRLEIEVFGERRSYLETITNLNDSMKKIGLKTGVSLRQ